MRLTDLEPAWLGFYDGPPQCGISFRCPCKPECRQRIHVMFDTSITDQPAPAERGGAPRWRREGRTFETLTLTPSIDASSFGHWHGWIRAGEIVSA